MKICTWLFVAGAKGCSIVSALFIWKTLKVSVQKKVQGEPISPMERENLAYDMLVIYLFLWMLPNVAESTLTCTILGNYLDCLSLDLRSFHFVFFCMTWNIKVWKNKFGKFVVKFNDRCTDSLMKFDIAQCST